MKTGGMVPAPATLSMIHFLLMRAPVSFQDLSIPKQLDTLSMATIVNTPGTPVERSDSSAGWAVAVIILLLLIVGAFFVWGRYRGGNAAPAAPSANINVTLPAPAGGTGGSPPSGSGAVAPQ